MHITQWPRLSLTGRRNVLQSIVLLMQMDTKERSTVFHNHVKAATQCMNAGRHGMRSQAKGATINIGAMQCAADTYWKFCTTCCDEGLNRSENC